MASSEKRFTDASPPRTSNEQGQASECYDDSEALLGTPGTVSSRAKHLRSLNKLDSRSVLLAIALVIILIESALLVHIQRTSRSVLYTSNGLSYERTIDRILYDHTSYLSHNETEASLAWEAILPGHGVIAIEPDYIAQKNLPASKEMPDGSGKFLYAVEAYHAMHCIRTTRAHYLALEKGETWDWSRPHDLHCFDALRQYVMCNVDDTLLWTTGHRESGAGQAKKCNDWDALRAWTEERTANYFDAEPDMGIPHMDNYHEGDGLTW